MIQVRFIYKNNLFGEWADAADGAYLYPNPEFRADIVAVQARDNGNVQPPARASHARSRAKNRDGQKYRGSAVPNEAGVPDG